MRLRRALLAGLLAFPSHAAAPPPAGAFKDRSLVLISIDTLRADHLGAYGYTRPTSPNLDALARESLLFERCYSHSPKTATSHMSLFTGVLPTAHGVLNWDEGGTRRPEELKTLAALLKRAGYRTAAYTGGGNVSAGLGFDDGFDTYVDTDTTSLALAELALEDLARARRPFFIFVHTYAVHDPYLPPPDHAALFVDPGYAGRIVASLQALGGGGDWLQLHRAYWARVTASPADRRHVVDLYDGGIHAMDADLGRLVGSFRKLLGGEALLVLVSDHGEEFQEHGRWTHNSLYDEVLHVPLLVRFPDGAHAGRVSALARLSDVMPSLLEWLGLDAPPYIQGASLLPLLAGGDRRPRPHLAEWNSMGMSALRTGDVKYLRMQKGEELYDLAQDPREQRNLLPAAADRAYPLRLGVERLFEACFALKERLGTGQAPRLDAQTRKQLEALGYVAP